MKKCYHQRVIQYDEFEDEDGEIVSCDFEICKDCNAVLLNDVIIGYKEPEGLHCTASGMGKEK